MRVAGPVEKNAGRREIDMHRIRLEVLFYPDQPPLGLSIQIEAPEPQRLLHRKPLDGNSVFDRLVRKRRAGMRGDEGDLMAATAKRSH